MSNVSRYSAPKINRVPLRFLGLGVGLVTFHVGLFQILILRYGTPAFSPWVEPGDWTLFGVMIVIIAMGLATTFSWRITAIALIPFGILIASSPIYSPIQTLQIFFPPTQPVIILAVVSLFVSALYAVLIIFGVRAKKGGIKGTAQWGEARVLRGPKKYGIVGQRTPEKGFILGRWKDGGLLRYGKDGHLITVAATRSGKGVGTIIPNLLDHPGSLLCSDPKGENWFVTSEHRRRMGQKTIALDPFGITGGETGGFNPMDALDLGDPGAEEMAMSMAENMVGHGEGQEAFWVNEAKAILVTFILYAKTARDPKKQNLAHVRKLVSVELKKFNEILDDMILRCENPLVKEGANRIKQKEPKELSGVLSTLQSKTHVFSSPMLAATLAQTTFTKEDILSDNTSIYVIVPREYLVAYASWMRTTIVSIYGLITKGAHDRKVKPKHRILFMLDEFANLGKIEEMLDAFSLGAGFGISFWVILQDFSQLKHHYGESWNSFIANSDIIQVFGIQDQFSCEQVTGFMGDTTVWERKLSKEKDKSVVASIDEETRKLMTADELRRLRPDRQIIFARPHLPVCANKIKFYEDPDFKELASPNPYLS